MGNLAAASKLQRKLLARRRVAIKKTNFVPETFNTQKHRSRNNR